tara:strand:- start:2225 stop:2503 length:279 start_codon:yes stop_codon:yes gene_type:complete
MKINLLKGLILGIVSPIILFVITVVFFLRYNISDFVNHKINEQNIPAIISLCLLANLAVFFIKLQKNKDQQARGVLLSTFLFGILIIYFKFF